MAGPKRDDKAKKGAGGGAGRSGGEPKDAPSEDDSPPSGGGGIPIGMPVDPKTYEEMKRKSQISESGTDEEGEPASE